MLLLLPAAILAHWAGIGIIVFAASALAIIPSAGSHAKQNGPLPLHHPRLRSSLQIALFVTPVLVFASLFAISCGLLTLPCSG